MEVSHQVKMIKIELDRKILCRKCKVVLEPFTLSINRNLNPIHIMGEGKAFYSTGEKIELKLICPKCGKRISGFGDQVQVKGNKVLVKGFQTSSFDYVANVSLTSINPSRRDSYKS